MDFWQFADRNAEGFFGSFFLFLAFMVIVGCGFIAYVDMGETRANERAKILLATPEKK